MFAAICVATQFTAAALSHGPSKPTRPPGKHSHCRARRHLQLLRDEPKREPIGFLEDQPVIACAQLGFLIQAVHQPFALTRLPVNSAHGPLAAPGLPE
jgi:hypothetical protein